MTDINVGGIRRLRVWWDESPSHEFNADGWLSRQSQPATGLARLSKWAVELIVPTGPIWHFVHLGADFAPEGSRMFEVRVGYGTPVAVDPDWVSFPQGIDHLVLGLDRPAAECVLNALLGSTSRIQLASGRMRVSHAVMALAGSSPFILKAAARTLLLMPTVASDPDRSDQLRVIAQEALGWAFRSGKEAQ